MIILDIFSVKTIAQKSSKFFCVHPRQRGKSFGTLAQTIGITAKIGEVVNGQKISNHL